MKSAILIRSALPAVLALAASPSQAANLLTNGSFEAPPVASAIYLGATALTGMNTMPGWTVQLLPGTTPGTSIQLTNNAAFCSLGVCSSDGSQFLDLTGSVGRGGGVVSSGFATVAGASYQVSFDVGAVYVAGQGSFGDAEVVLQIDGTTMGAFFNKNDRVGPGTDWLRFTYDFVGTGNLMTVGLFSSLATRSSDYGVGLDNVVVQLTAAAPAVPEPATWVAMIAGFALVGSALRRRSAMALRPA